LESLRAIKDKKVQGEIARAIDGLEKEPERQGKQLVAPLEGILSVRVVKSRYRVLYKVEPEQRRVSVLLIGPRKPGENADVYAVARRLFEALSGD
jgi:mRNA-degrading endonuclease RelE of RelBE toxin-antitoxin system